MTAKNQPFHWKRLGAAIAFYSLAGLGSVAVLPAAGMLAVAFMFFGAVVPALGLMTLLASFVGVEVPWAMLQFGNWSAPPALAFPVAALTGLLLMLAGRGLWKFTVNFVRLIGQKHRALG